MPCMSPVSWCAGVSTPIVLISRAHSELVSGMLWAINDISLSCDSLMVTLHSAEKGVSYSAIWQKKNNATKKIWGVTWQ